MRFNSHSELEGQHAYLSASKGSWVNYDQEKFEVWLHTQLLAARGTRLHDLAQRLIKERQKLPDTNQTLCRYVNDCIGFGLAPEVTFFYSENAFGHADAAGFDMDNMLFRCSDLKTGVTHADVRQLEIYMALFCLEYGFKPFEVSGELRIYQNDNVELYIADPVVISLIMDKIVTFDRVIRQRKEQLG